VKAYKYFVSFNHNNGGGNLEISRASEIITMNDIKGIEKAIANTDGGRSLSGVVVMNYKLLRTDKETKDSK
jgi:hypothetical protein